MIQGFFPFILVLSFLYPVMSMSRALVAEKESRLREAMRMMGLPSWVNWLAWFIKDFTMLTITVILIVVIFSGGKVAYCLCDHRIAISTPTPFSKVYPATEVSLCAWITQHCCSWSTTVQTL